LSFRTTPATLIPRPDTETLVAAALEVLPENSAASVLDMGTGTGAVGISIAHERPNIALTLSDVSEAALDVARENAKILLTAKGFKGSVACVQSNWFERFPLDEFQSHFDLIASNPPYIKAEDEHLSQGDLRFEPQNALASGATGLDALTVIVSRAPKYLKRGGWLMVEHGYDQSEEVEALFRENGFREISHRRDLGGIQRVVCGQI
jgi:release factor glutamine methyltransferase